MFAREKHPDTRNGIMPITRAGNILLEHLPWSGVLLQGRSSEKETVFCVQSVNCMRQLSLLILQNMAYRKN